MKLSINLDQKMASVPVDRGANARQPQNGVFSALVSGHVCTFVSGAETFTAKMPFGLRGFNISAEVLINRYGVLITRLNGRKEIPPIQLTDVECASSD